MDSITAVLDRLDNLIDFFLSGIYDFIVEAYALFVEFMTVSAISFILWAVGFAWDISVQIIENLGLQQALDSAWGEVPPDAAQVMMFFAIPDVVSILLNAFLTAYVLKFIPFTGK